MKLAHLLQLVEELPNNSTLNYVRGTDTCEFVDVDVDGKRINSVAPNGETKSWAPSYLEDLAPKIKENVPFNLSGLLNNKGSYRPVLETIIAHTREFYTVRKGTATALVWIPSKPKQELELEEIPQEEIPEPLPETDNSLLLPPEELTPKVRDSFIKFWKLIDQHGVDFNAYISNFENAINPYLIKLGLGYDNIFQVVDYKSYTSIIQRMTDEIPETAYIKNGRQNTGVKYQVGSTHVHYSNYLQVLDNSDFRANIDKEQEEYQQEKLMSLLDQPLQLIYYGAPGTGKSFTIDQVTNENNSVRITFHPDSDYASFVGAYKPTMENVRMSKTFTSSKEGTYAEYVQKTDSHPGTEKKIVYKYVPQAFLKAYVEAWKRYAAGEDDYYYLVIEEINRGNCAQIFGDLFQLLDRNNMGCSSYAISADEDIAQFLREDDKGFGKLTEGQKEAISKFRLKKDSGVEEHIGPEILNGSKLLLPPNLRIWATMNTSDQSLFPIDSAFKRRWNWEYMPIEYDPTDKNTGERLAWKFEVRGKRYYWGKFLDYINPKILKLTMSEDKQMGYFFAKPDKRGTDGRLDVISEKVFVNKVLFYLWTDVFKDYDLTEKPFVYETTTAEGKSIKKSYRFTDFFPIEGNQKLIDFVRGMGLKVEDDGEQTPEQPSDENPTNIGNYVVNGTPVRFQNAVGAEAIKAYMSIYPEKTANEVVEDWKGLGQIVSYFVQTEAEHQARTDSRKAYVITIDCKGENIYVSKEGWGDNRPNGSIYALLNMVNAIKQKGWPIEIKGVE